MANSRLLFLVPAQSVSGVFPKLRDAGFELGIAENLKGASVFIRKSGPGVIFARPVLPGFRVEDLLAVGAEDPNFPAVIVVTDSGTKESWVTFRYILGEKQPKSVCAVMGREMPFKTPNMSFRWR